MSRVVPFGDGGWLVDVMDVMGVGDVGVAHRVADAIEEAVRDATAPDGVLGVTIGYGSVVVAVDATVDPGSDPEAWLAGLAGLTGLAGDAAAASDAGVGVGRSGRRSARTSVVEIPVVFDGDDLDEVAADLGRSIGDVVDLLTGVDLEVAFLGFAPGFPYLVGLPGPLAGLSRRATPRVSVPAGSVAVAGGYAAVYPRSTPGGWNLLGRTGMTLFDPQVPPYARLRAGDTVRFRAADVPLTPGDPVAARRPPLTAEGHRWLRVLDPGLFTLVQDVGRPSLGTVGVPVAGPADPVAMTLANRLVGNPDGSATLEVTARGPSLAFGADLHLAVVGASAGAVDLRVDDRPAPTDAVVPVRAGQVVTVGAVRSGLRAYVALAGGLQTPQVVGSKSSDVLSGLGTGPLVIGDHLGVGMPGRPHGLLTSAHDALASGDPIRVLAGPTVFDEAGRELGALVASAWEVGADSNRIGVRLRCTDTLLHPPLAGIPSTGMLTGAIQVPPDGAPIVLLPDHATVGGYPVIATVITADLGRLGQLRSGDVVHFEQVSSATARTARIEQERAMTHRIKGWFPTESGT